MGGILPWQDKRWQVMIGIVMFAAALFMLLLGFPVAFTFGAVAVIFGFIYGLSEAWDYAQGFEILTEAF